MLFWFAVAWTMSSLLLLYVDDCLLLCLQESLATLPSLQKLSLQCNQLRELVIPENSFALLEVPSHCNLQSTMYYSPNSLSGGGSVAAMKQTLTPHLDDIL
jgi:Leucine-rich repeat (LRR) protein